MDHHIPAYIGTEAIPVLIRYCQQSNLSKFVLVSDRNTFAVLGSKVETALRHENYDVITIVLEGQEIIADANYLLEVFLKIDREERVFLAVGTGTITDISRFVSHRSKNVFISIPTAPSVDGFNSMGAPLVVGGLKKTYTCRTPVALFADLATLVEAPKLLIASGYGDLVGKLFSAADWKLGHLLWDEPYDPIIADRTRQAALNVVGLAENIASGDQDAIRLLMEGLIELGFCMSDFGNSSPASGAEHHISHYWEMMLLRLHRPAIFHGVKVGIASVISAEWYHRIKQTSQDEVKRLLENAKLPESETEKKKIELAFGTRLAAEIILDQESFIHISEVKFEALKAKITDQWGEIQEIARQVPEPDEITMWLGQVGAPTKGEQIGFSSQEIAEGKNYGHYLRRRFTINKLRLLLGW